MGMGFAPTWLRQVSPLPSPLLHMTTLTTGKGTSMGLVPAGVDGVSDPPFPFRGRWPSHFVGRRLTFDQVKARSAGLLVTAEWAGRDGETEFSV